MVYSARIQRKKDDVMKTIFLAGPMRGFSDAEGRKKTLGWREEAKEMLSSHFIVKHAYRGREEKETFPDPKGAIIRDKQDVLSADIIIVNDTIPGASMIGTAMEVLFAFLNNKTIIVFGDAHKGDYWLDYHATMRVSDMQEAIQICKKLFNE